MPTPEIVFPCPGAGRVVHFKDTTANDSDMVYTVPDGHVWQLLRIKTELAATATVGNRVLKVAIRDPSDAYLHMSPGVTVAASQFGVLELGTGSDYGTTVANCPRFNGGAPNACLYGQYLPPEGILLPGGYDIRVYDSAAIDAAADDLTIVLYYIDYTMAME